MSAGLVHEFAHDNSETHFKNLDIKVDTQNNESNKDAKKINVDKENKITFDKRKLFLRNVPKKKKIDDVKRYISCLTNANFVSCKLHDEKTGTWLVNLESDIGLLKNYKITLSL